MTITITTSTTKAVLTDYPAVAFCAAASSFGCPYTSDESVEIDLRRLASQDEMFYYLLDWLEDLAVQRGC